MVSSGTGKPAVFIASYNTRRATELAIRSLHKFAGCPFDLTVGDSASRDGSAEMLARMERQGWLQLRSSSDPVSHAAWLDEFLKTCDSEYALIIDSDIELLRHETLSALMAEAKAREAAIVGVETEPRAMATTYDGVPVMSPGRPASVWLMLVNVPVVRRLGISTEPVMECNPIDPDCPIHYDVFSKIESRLLAEGEPIVLMPPAFRRCYRHFRGLSWRREGGLRRFRHYLRYCVLLVRLGMRRIDTRMPSNVR